MPKTKKSQSKKKSTQGKSISDKKETDQKKIERLTKVYNEFLPKFQELEKRGKKIIEELQTLIDKKKMKEILENIVDKQ